MLEIKIKKIPYYEGKVRFPEYKTLGASGMDLYAPEGQVIMSQHLGVIACGFALEIPYGYEAQIRDRSGVAKSGVKVFGGTIDSDYRGEVHVMLYNFSRSPINIMEGDRVAQMVFNRVVDVEFKEVSELSPTDRGTGGFGHTGR